MSGRRYTKNLLDYIQLCRKDIDMDLQLNKLNKEFSIFVGKVDPDWDSTLKDKNCILNWSSWCNDQDNYLTESIYCLYWEYILEHIECIVVNFIYCKWDNLFDKGHIQKNYTCILADRDYSWILERRWMKTLFGLHSFRLGLLRTKNLLSKLIGKYWFLISRSILECKSDKEMSLLKDMRNRERNRIGKLMSLENSH